MAIWTPDKDLAQCVVGTVAWAALAVVVSHAFSVTTGEVLAGPAESGLEPYPASVAYGRILLG